MQGNLNVPLSVILSWPRSNYVDPVTRPNTAFLLACVFGPVTVTMLMARLWVRIYHQRNAGWDDWLLVTATIPTTALTILVPIAIRNGFDRHIWDISPVQNPDKVVASRKYVLAILCIFCIASGLIKISILLFYRRLSSRIISKRFRWVTWLTIGSMATYSVAFTLAPILGCNPISAFWDQMNYTKLAKGYEFHCFNEGADILSASIISTAQDLITAILPTFLYWNLRIPVRQKIALFGIFAIGYGVAALGALRIYYSWKIYYGTYDITWVTWDLLLITMLELHVGCFCANAPTLKVFFKHFFHEKLTSSAKQSNASDQKGQKNSANPATQSSKSSASTLKKKISMLFSKGSSSYTGSGYLAEPHANISVDAHGGVQVLKEVHVAHSPALTTGTQPIRRDLRVSTDTTDMICGRYYDDIEMGHFTTRRNSQVSSLHSQGLREEMDVEALPPMPQTSRSPRAMRSLMLFNSQPRSPTYPEWLSRPFPATIAEERIDDGARLNPFPSRSTSTMKPPWQTWS